MFSTFQSLISSSPVARGSNASASIHQESDPTHHQLLDIFQKIKNGTGLNSTELSFLNSTSTYTPPTPPLSARFSTLIFTPADEGSVCEINSLTDQVFKRKLAASEVLSQVERKLLANDHPTDREAASLARLINSCLTRDGSFGSALEEFQSKKGRMPRRGELIDMVARFNREMLPKISLAGTVIGKVCALELGGRKETVYEIKYNAQGHLEILDGPVAPLDISCTQVLSKKGRREVCELYQALSKTTLYNNLGELLEFISYIENQKKSASALTLSEIYDSYNPDLPHILDKYQGGACILLATKFCQELEKRGIAAQNLATTAVGQLNHWSTLPIPGTEANPIKWMNYSDELRGVDHTSAICFFQDEHGREGALKFECSFEEDYPDEIKEYLSTNSRSGVQQFLAEVHYSDSEDHPNRVVDCGNIGKGRLKGRFKALIMKGKNVLGIDFLRDNFYINQSWAKTMIGLPLNARGMLSIDLEALANPDETGIYYIDGMEIEISHREALRIVLAKVGPELYLPEDTETNIIALAKHRTALFAEFFIQPLPLIKANYKDLLAIGKKMDTIKSAMPESEEYGMLLGEFNQAIEPLFQYVDAEEASKKIAIFKARVLEFEIS